MRTDRIASVTTENPAAENAATPPTDDLPEQLRIRREKRERLLAQGTEAYPVSVPVTDTIAEVREVSTTLPPRSSALKPASCWSTKAR